MSFWGGGPTLCPALCQLLPPGTVAQSLGCHTWAARAQAGPWSSLPSPRTDPTRLQHHRPGEPLPGASTSSPGVSTLEHCFQLPFPGPPAAFPGPPVSYKHQIAEPCWVWSTVTGCCDFNCCLLLHSLTPTAPGSLLFSSLCPSFPSLCPWQWATTAPPSLCHASRGLLVKKG